jgi:hypothetical protein
MDLLAPLGPELPAAAAAWLDASAELCATPPWFAATLAAALPPGTGRLAAAGPVALLLRAEGRALHALETPYTLTWRPLLAHGAGAPAIEDAAATLGRLFRRRPPARLDCLPEDAPGLAAVAAGLRRAGLRLLPFAHFGNRREAIAGGWEGYLAARPSALQNTIRRKLARAAREARIERISTPGAALEDGIAAFQAVRARSWKPHEPWPDFDAALMRGLAAAGTLRLGVLRAADGTPIAAQYWALQQGGRSAVVPKLFHDEARKAASPGTVLTATMIRAMIDEDGVAEVDFGRGDDPYKQAWTAARRQRIGWLLADPWHPLGLAAIGRATARQVLRGAGLHGKFAKPDA